MRTWKTPALLARAWPLWEQNVVEQVLSDGRDVLMFSWKSEVPECRHHSSCCYATACPRLLPRHQFAPVLHVLFIILFVGFFPIGVQKGMERLFLEPELVNLTLPLNFAGLYPKPSVTRCTHWYFLYWTHSFHEMAKGSRLWLWQISFWNHCEHVEHAICVNVSSASVSFSPVDPVLF